jgi:hypothetical protein
MALACQGLVATFKAAYPKWPGRTNGFNLIFFTELYRGCNPVIKMFRYGENTTMQEHIYPQPIPTFGLFKTV